MNQKEIFSEAFAPGIWKNISEYKKIVQRNTNNSTDQLLKSTLKAIIKESIRKFDDRPVDMISEKARDKAESYNKEKNKKFNIENFLFGDRNNLGKTDNKPGLMFEHTTPVEELFLTLIKCQSEDEVKIELNKCSGVCIITREEDNKLNLKYKSDRKLDWVECYKECGIKIIKLNRSVK
jgi:hypothetical protein